MQLFSCIQGQSITFINRGIIFANLGMHTEALADYETGIEMGHNSIVCDFLRGISCYALGDFRVAIQWFDKVVERLDIIGCAGINYEPIGMDYAVYALKAHFNKAACLDVLGEDGSTQMLQNAAKDIQDAELPDERLHSDLIYSLVRVLWFVAMPILTASCASSPMEYVSDRRTQDTGMCSRDDDGGRCGVTCFVCRTALCKFLCSN